MQKFIFRLSDGKNIERTIDAKDENEALSIALTALSTFASSKFPPPEKIEITVMDVSRSLLATLRFQYEIEIADVGGWILPN